MTLENAEVPEVIRIAFDNGVNSCGLLALSAMAASVLSTLWDSLWWPVVLLVQVALVAFGVWGALRSFRRGIVVSRDTISIRSFARTQDFQRSDCVGVTWVDRGYGGLAALVFKSAGPVACPIQRPLSEGFIWAGMLPYKEPGIRAYARLSELFGDLYRGPSLY